MKTAIINMFTQAKMFIYGELELYGVQEANFIWF